VAQSDWKIEFCVSRQNKSSLPDPKTTQPCPRAQENPTNDSSKFHWLPKPHKILQIPLKKVSIPSNRKINQNSPNFPPKLKKLQRKKNRLNFPKE
jgi:hypothetical protein